MFVVTKVVAQNGTISGSVRTSDGEPVELVTVNVKGTAKGALTDRNGKYQIRKHWLLVGEPAETKKHDIERRL